MGDGRGNGEKEQGGSDAGYEDRYTHLPWALGARCLALDATVN